jgi:hypothetical protein
MSSRPIAEQRSKHLAIPLFGYQNHVSIDRHFCFMCRWAATDAAAYEGRRLREGLIVGVATAAEAARQIHGGNGRTGDHKLAERQWQLTMIAVGSPLPLIDPEDAYCLSQSL